MSTMNNNEGVKWFCFNFCFANRAINEYGTIQVAMNLPDSIQATEFSLTCME